MSAHHINESFVLSVRQKLSKLVDIWRTCDQNNFAQFFWDPVYNCPELGDPGLIPVSRHYFTG